MKQADAQRLVAKLFAAFPFRKTDLTAAVYLERMLQLEQPEAHTAVEKLIDNWERLPTIADLHQAYRLERERTRAAVPALGPARLSPEERAENLRRLRELAEGLKRAPESRRL